MLKAINENGELKNLVTNDEGILKVEVVGQGESGEDNNTTIINTEDNPVPVKEVGEEKEYTVKSDIMTVGTTATTVEVNQDVTSIMVANYSDEADVTINTGVADLKVGANLAIELPINANVTNLSITSTVDDTKIQLVVKGVI